MGPSGTGDGSGCSARRGCIAQQAGLWALLSLLLNLPWEIVQLPLYTLVSARETSDVVYAILHCTIGDMLIATVTCVATGLLLRRMDWPRSTPLAGLALLTVMGIVYTAWSEWRNVYQLGSWAYAAEMPQVYGIGLSPLLQWLMVPAATLVSFRFLRREA